MSSFAALFLYNFISKRGRNFLKTLSLSSKNYFSFDIFTRDGNSGTRRPLGFGKKILTIFFFFLFIRNSGAIVR